jgi:hypothetical protein
MIKVEVNKKKENNKFNESKEIKIDEKNRMIPYKYFLFLLFFFFQISNQIY